MRSCCTTFQNIVTIYYRNIKGPKLLHNCMILFTLNQKHFYPRRNMYWCRTSDYDVLLCYRTCFTSRWAIWLPHKQSLWWYSLPFTHPTFPLRRRSSNMPSIYNHKKLWPAARTNHHNRPFSANRSPARAEAIRAMPLTNRRLF